MIGGSALGEQLLYQLRRGEWEGCRVVDNDALLQQNISEHERPGMSLCRQAGYTEDMEPPGPAAAGGRGGKKMGREMTVGGSI